jgi:hypothetical protein
VTVKTMTLTDFLLARIEEDVVKRVTMREWHAADCETIPAFGSEYSYPCDCGVPERMARECEAKRRIVAEHAEGDSEYCRRCKGEDVDIGGPTVRMYPVPIEYPCPTLRALALSYADHPGYRQEWKL